MKQTLFVLPSKDSFKKFDVPARQQSMQIKQVGVYYENLPYGKLQYFTLAQFLVGWMAWQQFPKICKSSAHVLLPKSFSKIAVLTGNPSKYANYVPVYL